MDDRMMSIGELLAGSALMGRIYSDRGISQDGLSSDPAARKALTRQLEFERAERYNQTPGTLGDGIDCKRCLNRGDYMRMDELENGALHERYERCACMAARESVRRMQASGMAQSIKTLRFDNYQAAQPWQEGLLKAARAYAADEGATGWFFMGGAVGSGKTHLCTAICREMLAAHKGVYYCPWTVDVVSLKQRQYDDPDSYDKLMVRLKNISVLYIDDLFKPLPGADRPTDADVRLAYEIINHRYINQLRTIITCERYSEELLGIDEATGSRIIERARGNTWDIKRDKTRNYRIKGGTMV